jgi:Na+-driven multidrug efflux pump
MSEKNPRILAGAGMGNIVITMMCVAVFQGMNGALETLISQAIGAAT